MGGGAFSKLTGMTHQPSFAHAKFNTKKKTTRRQRQILKFQNLALFSVSLVRFRFFVRLEFARQLLPLGNLFQ